MLDSLVRVSRRVGWKADRFATDPDKVARPAVPRTDREGAVGRHGLPLSPPVELPRRAGQPRKHAVVPRLPSGLRRERLITGRLGTNPEPTYHPPRLLTARAPVVATDLRKVHNGGVRRDAPAGFPTRAKGMPCRSRPEPRAALNPAGLTIADPPVYL